MPVFQVNTAWASMTEVIPNLYICGVSALKPSTILALNFDLIVNCTKEVPNMNLPPDVERLKLWLEDTDETDLGPSLLMAVDYIRMILEVDGRVLVHCVAGVSRSAAVCLAYLIKHESMTLRRAYEHMASRRARVRPNIGFWRQLIEFEMEMRHEMSVEIKKISSRSSDDDSEEGFVELPDVYDEYVKVDRREELATRNPYPEPALDGPLAQKQSYSELKKAERKRHRQLSDNENGKRFVPKLAPLLEVEQ